MRDSVFIETAKVAGGAAVATGITIADINAWLSFTSLVLAISYGLRKWYLMEKDKKKNRSPYSD